MALMINLACAGSATAGTEAEKVSRDTAKVKASIARLGVGPEARVEVKLRDKTKLKGYISEAGDERFIIIDAKTGAPTTVAYSNVKQMKGKKLSSGIKIAIGVVLALVVIGVIFGRKD